MLSMETVQSISGVTLADYSNSTLQFAWGTGGAFATKEEALAAFYNALQEVSTAYGQIQSRIELCSASLADMFSPCWPHRERQTFDWVLPCSWHCFLWLDPGFLCR
jgi:hypothetical protein